MTKDDNDKDNNNYNDIPAGIPKQRRNIYAVVTMTHKSDSDTKTN